MASLSTLVDRWRQMRHRKTVAAIIRRCEALAPHDDSTLLKCSHELRWRLWAGENSQSLLPAAFALVRESARRTIGMAHFPEQLAGGIALFAGHIAQMQTGEGKTLTALLPAYLHALAGKGCHVVTANDYLAQRDASLAAAVLGPLGISVGCVDPRQKPAERRAEYGKDITYSTAREIGFDFLRDRLKAIDGGLPGARETVAAASGDDDAAPVQRGLYFALVDEADSILIDDARTPLIIAHREPGQEAAGALSRWSLRRAGDLAEGADFVIDRAARAAHLTHTGCLRLVRAPQPARLESFGIERLYHQVEQALTALYGFDRDRHYVVTEQGKLAIVDESTGRILEGRKWQAGLHQAIEAKERLPITEPTRTAARITVQTFFRSYPHLAGMTGTAWPAAAEFKNAYRLVISRIPTHRPSRRRKLPARVFSTAAAKRLAIVESVTRFLECHRAALLGAPSVASSEALAAALSGCGIDCQVLNCLSHRDEAAIIAEAGRPGRVTIATNMAGRGTDIGVDPAVLSAGGLHVIATEMHSSRRIDQQLVGRTARQGEPGSFQFLLSLDDELLGGLGPERLERLRRRAQGEVGVNGELPRAWLRLFRRVQSSIETQHARQRHDLLRYERRHLEACRQTGLDPYLDVVE
jgi:preprotein translocase subunit SecA